MFKKMVCLVIVGFLLAGSAAALTVVIRETNEQMNVTVEKAMEMIKSCSDDVVMLDVRTASEYDTDHIPDAIFFPLSSMSCELCIYSKLDTYQDKNIIVYCKNGEISKEACSILRDNGFEHVYNLVGGIDAWDAAGFPVEEGDTPKCECLVMTDIPPKSDEGMGVMDPDPDPPMDPGDLPNQFSWLNYNGNWMTPVKQQQCGDCWDFSALGGLEAAINIGSGYPDLDIDLSEQYVLSCLSAAGSCSGGWMSEAIMYIYSTSPGPTGNGINGCTIESCMPYQGVDYIPCSDKCDDWDYFTDPPQPDNKLWQVKNYGVSAFSEDDPNGWDTMKTWIFTYGPIIVDIVAGGAFGSWGYSHHSPNDVYEYDDPGITDHGVVLCGWVDDPDILNGGYWIIKNSWGTSWGYGGFANIAYGCNSLGTRDVTWVTATEWPPEKKGPGPGGYDIHVFADFTYSPEYPHVGEEIKFTDTSDGDVALREWDFDDDGIIDSNKKSPTWTYMEEGEYDVTLTVWSSWGLNSNRTKTIGVKENWPPIAICDPEEYPEEPGDNELEIHFDGRYSYDPDGKITNYHWDFDDGTTADGRYLWHTFPEPDTIYNVTLTVTDDDGASGSTICIVKIDQNVPPVTTAHFWRTGSKWGVWYKDTKRVYLEATDWTLVIDTYYRLDGSEWKRYVPSENKYIVISEEGIHTLEFYSVDYYHNEEAVKTREIKIDKTPPTLDISITGAEKENGWYHHAVTVKLLGDDQPSGIDKIMYSLDYGEWNTYTNPFTVEGDGIHRLEASAIDLAGNTYNIGPIDIPIDINTQLDAVGSLNWNNVDPGETVYDSFKVMNVGDPGSELRWEVAEYPDWGTWSFSPSSGSGLTPEEGKITVDVAVTAPNEENTDFSGDVKVVNCDDSGNYKLIPVSLSTPANNPDPDPDPNPNPTDPVQIVSINPTSATVEEGETVDFTVEVTGGSGNFYYLFYGGDGGSKSGYMGYTITISYTYNTEGTFYPDVEVHDLDENRYDSSYDFAIIQVSQSNNNPI